MFLPAAGDDTNVVLGGISAARAMLWIMSRDCEVGCAPEAVTHSQVITNGGAPNEQNF